MTEPKEKTENDTKNNKNRSNKNGGLGSAAVFILVGAGIFIFVLSLTEAGGMAVPFYIALTALALVVATLISTISKSLKEIESGDTKTGDENQVTSKPLEEIISAPQTESHPRILKILRAPIIWVAIVFGIVGIITTFLYFHRENTGINVQWNYYPKPEDSPIEKLTSDGSKIMVKTQSEQYFTARAYERCYGDYCWHRESSFENIIYEDKSLDEFRLNEIKILEDEFKEIESTFNDSACYTKTSQKYPPEGQISDALIFRECMRGDVRETRIIVAEDGGLWVWYNSSSQSQVIINTFIISIFMSPTIALVGTLLYKAFSSAIKREKN
jgi:hypothetical protein